MSKRYEPSKEEQTLRYFFPKQCPRCQSWFRDKKNFESISKIGHCVKCKRDIRYGIPLEVPTWQQSEYPYKYGRI